MQRYRSTWCTPLFASGLLALLAWGFASVSANSACRAQEPDFLSPPLAPIFPAGQTGAPGADRQRPLELQPIPDPQVRPADFQLAVPAGRGFAAKPPEGASPGLAEHSAIAPVLTSTDPPLANAIREFIEPDVNQGEERTSASLFQLSTLQLGQLDWQKMLASLAVVIGGYLGLVMLLRLWNPHSSSALPREVVEVLGTTSLNSRQSLQLVRLGSKLLLLIHSPEGTQSLGEISNPHEVEHLAQICCQRRGRKSATAFRKFSENQAREPLPAPPLDSLLKNLQLALQRTPGRTEYEA